jgi:hypothetical protein
MRVFSGESSSPRVSSKLATRGLTSSTNGSRELPEMEMMKVVRVAHQIERILPSSTRINDRVI